MKNTKRYLLAALAIGIIVATMLLMVACGGSHKHDYTYKSTVTNPTCTEKGYTTYTCKCGESKVDDYVDPKHDLVEHSAKPANCTEAGHEAYVTCKNCDYTTYKEIPAGEHYYDCSIVKIPTAEKAGKAIYTCDGCGDSYEAEITLEDIELPDVMGFVASIIGDGYYSIDLGDGFNLVIIKEITEEKSHYEETEDFGGWFTDTTFEGTKSFLAVKLPKAYLDIKDAYMKAEIEVQVGTAEIGFDEDDNPEEISFVDFDVESSYALKIDGNKIDVKLVSGEETEEFSATVYELALLLVSRYTGASLEYETMLEVYAVLQQLECFVPVFETISEKLAALEQVESDVDFTALISVLTALGSNVIEETTDGDNTVYTLKLENLSKYVDYLKEATVADMLNDAFGEKFADTLKAFVVSVPTLTVKEIADAAIAVSETYGLDVDEFYALINGIVYLAAGAEFDIAGEIDKRNEYTLAKIVAEMMGAPADQMDDIAASFTAQVEQVITMILGSTVDDIFELIAPKKDAPAMPDGEEGAETETETEPEEEKSLTEILEGFVALLGEEVEAVVVVDGNGNVKSIDFSVSEMVTGSYEVDENGDVNATVGLADFELVYSSANDAYTVVLNAAGNKIVEGTVTVTEGGYEFVGNVYAGEVIANLTVDIGLDGTIDATLTVVGGEADVEMTVKLDKENVDLAIKSDERILFNLDVDIADGKVVKVNIDGYNLLKEPANMESIDGTPVPPTIKYEHAFGLYYLDNGEGTYTLNVKMPTEKTEISFLYDGANLDAVVKFKDIEMLNLYVDIADGKVTAVDFDIYDYTSEKKLKDEYVDIDPSIFPDWVLPDDCYELIETKRHLCAIDYTDNGDTTYSLTVAVPYDEVKVEFKLDLTNKTLAFKATEAENTVLDGTVTVTADKLTVVAKAYDEEETMDITLELSASGLDFDVVLYVNDEPDKKYPVIDFEIVAKDGVVTSAHFVNNALYTVDDPEEALVKELINIITITYTYEDNVATIVFKNGDAAESVITLTIGENGAAVDVLVKVFETTYDEDFNPVGKEEVVLFDGQLGLSVTSEDGKHSFTVSVDVDKAVTDSHDYTYEYDVETDVEYDIYILKALILAFEGDITFSYEEVK